MRRIFLSLTALALLAGVCGPAVLGCGNPIPEPQPGPQKGVIHYIDDHLGNAHLITDSQGNILREESRYPYGLDWRIDGSDVTTADYVYTGKEYDAETGLVYFGGRYYSPEMGRWITPDLHFLENPETVLTRPLESNLYSYVRDNPVRWIDPDGEAAGDPYPTQHDAARTATMGINPTSIAQNVEYAGFVYEKSKNVYSYTKPFDDGKKNKVEIGKAYSRLKDTLNITAYYHTHAASDPKYYNEIFSTPDRTTGELGDTGVAEVLNLDAYLGTPKGRILYYDYTSDVVNIMNGDPLQSYEIPDNYPLLIINEPSWNESFNIEKEKQLEPF